MLLRANQLRDHLLRERQQERNQENSEAADEDFLEACPEAAGNLAAERWKQEQEALRRQFTPLPSGANTPALGHSNKI